MVLCSFVAALESFEDLACLPVLLPAGLKRNLLKKDTTALNTLHSIYSYLYN